MRLLEFIQKSNAVDRKIVTAPNFDKLLNYLEAGISMAELADNQGDLLKTIPGPQLKRLSDARRSWLELETEREELLLELKGKNISINEEIFSNTLTMRRLEALRHIIPVLNPSDFSSPATWLEAVTVVLEVWTGALNLTLKKGEIIIVETGKNDTSGDYSDIIGKRISLANINGTVWARIRRAMRAKLVDLDFEYPESSIRSHLQAVSGKLSVITEKYVPDELLKLLVIDHLAPAVMNSFDNKLRDELLKELASQYVDILRTAPIRVPKMGAFYPSSDGQTVSVSVINDKGKIVAYETIEITDSWPDDVRVFFVKNKTSYVVVPVMANDHGTVELIREKVGNFLVFIPSGVNGLEDDGLLADKSFENLPGDVCRSVILSRRMLFPARELSNVDPLRLLNIRGDGDEQAVREYLLEQKGLALMDPTIDRIPPRVLSQSPASLIASGAKLNPEIRSIDDVKIGMELTGVIINITKFGAFVNIGLNQEALIHVSEMADDFVNDPFEIVSLGQQVKVSVVGVDMEKNRISLSLRSTPRIFDGKPMKRSFEPRPRAKDEKYQSPSARSQALKDLENLFRK